MLGGAGWLSDNHVEEKRGIILRKERGETGRVAACGVVVNAPVIQNPHPHAFPHLLQQIRPPPPPHTHTGCTNDSDACRWVSAVAVARGSDLVASAAGNGVVRFWAVEGTPGHRSLKPIGAVALRGFVNALRFGASGRVLVAAVGREPRMGRWGCDKEAVNGVVVMEVPLADEGEEEEEGG